MAKNKEMKDNIKKFREEAQKLENSDALQVTTSIGSGCYWSKHAAVAYEKKAKLSCSRDIG